MLDALLGYCCVNPINDTKRCNFSSLMFEILWLRLWHNAGHHGRVFAARNSFVPNHQRLKPGNAGGSFGKDHSDKKNTLQNSFRQFVFAFGQKKTTEFLLNFFSRPLAFEITQLSFMEARREANLLRNRLFLQDLGLDGQQPNKKRRQVPEPDLLLKPPIVPSEDHSMLAHAPLRCVCVCVLFDPPLLSCLSYLYLPLVHRFYSTPQSPASHTNPQTVLKAGMCVILLGEDEKEFWLAQVLQDANQDKHMLSVSWRLHSPSCCCSRPRRGTRSSSQPSLVCSRSPPNNTHTLTRTSTLSSNSLLHPPSLPPTPAQVRGCRFVPFDGNKDLAWRESVLAVLKLGSFSQDGEAVIVHEDTVLMLQGMVQFESTSPPVPGAQETRDPRQGFDERAVFAALQACDSAIQQVLDATLFLSRIYTALTPQLSLFLDRQGREAIGQDWFSEVFEQRTRSSQRCWGERPTPQPWPWASVGLRCTTGSYFDTCVQLRVGS